jgi:hypothetical protein
MHIEAKSILPTMKVVLDFKVRTVFNIELHYDCAKLLTYTKDEKHHKIYNLPKDVYLKVAHNPYE